MDIAEKGMFMKKIISLVITIAIIAAGVYFVPKLVHKCDDCGKIFIGTGYEPNVVEDLISDEDMTICKGCAEEQHMVAIFAGKSVYDFQKALF